MPTKRARRLRQRAEPDIITIVRTGGRPPPYSAENWNVLISAFYLHTPALGDAELGRRRDLLDRWRDRHLAAEQRGRRAN